MKVGKGIFMSWLVVKEIEPAVKFYTEVVGLTLKELNKHYGSAEPPGPRWDYARTGSGECRL